MSENTQTPLPLHEDHTLCEHFRAKVRKTDTCWVWMGSKDGRKAYGRYWIRGRKRGAHRVAWEIANERSVPDGLHILHRCDSPDCVNPAHLFPGTRSDNMRDASKKGRLFNPHRVLEPSQIGSIRARHKQGSTTRDLADEHKVSPRTILDVIHRVTWKEVV